MAACRFPFPAHPVTAWPVSHQTLWTRWTPPTRPGVRNKTENKTDLKSRPALARAWGYWLAWTQRSGRPTEPTPEAIAAYFTTLTGFLKRSSAVSYLIRVAKVAGVIFPDGDWRWLQARLGRWRCKHFPPRKPYQPRPPRAADPACGLPLADWPPALRQAWDRALMPPAPQSMAERQAARRAARAAATAATPSLPAPQVGQAAAGTGRRHSLPPWQWRPATQSNVRVVIGLWLGFARRQGLPDRPGPDGVAEWVDTLDRRRLSDHTTHDYVVWLHAAAKVLWPIDDWRWLAEDAELLSQGLVPKRVKAAKASTLKELFEAALDLVKAAEADPQTLAAARLYRAGLMLALLVFRPVRLGNLCELAIGTHIALDEAGVPIRLVVDTKRGRRSWEFPEEILPLWWRYWNWFRPMLPGHALGPLTVWPARDGRPMRPRPVRAHLTAAVAAVLGKKTNPHLIRDALATALVEEGHAEAARHLLGHRDLRSLVPYIETASSKRAAARVRPIVARLRAARGP